MLHEKICGDGNTARYEMSLGTITIYIRIKPKTPIITNRKISAQFENQASDVCNA